MPASEPASGLIDQALDEIEGIYSGRYTLGTDLGPALRHVLTGLVATILERKDTRREHLEQQLAQARNDAEHFAELAQEGDMQMAALLDWRDQARALLAELASDEAEPVFALNQEQNDGYECLRCDTYIYSYEPGQFPHAPECPWLRARAFLAAP